MQPDLIKFLVFGINKEPKKKKKKKKKKNHGVGKRNLKKTKPYTQKKRPINMKHLVPIT
eukprot:NODE_31514_length_395_cov_0.858209.p1 GENE.NODE_31514_length_395_cov_0.858209~~NODE_31514_length_395_cov_0.858209.p1  ORF type:complete len:59 (+),score=23.44 NODE_31514_length_395_cov_0.858209:152-328(+)